MLLRQIARDPETADDCIGGLDTLARDLRPEARGPAASAPDSAGLDRGQAGHQVRAPVVADLHDQLDVGGEGGRLKQRIADIDTFTADLRRACAGATVLDPEVVRLMMARARGDREPLQRLTSRQLEVLALMAEGRTNAYIARTLCVSERAVVQHTSHIYDELDLPDTDENHRRVLAVLRYLADEG